MFIFEEHNIFITVSYGATALVFLTAVLWVLVDGKLLNKSLEALTPADDEKED